MIINLIKSNLSEFLIIKLIGILFLAKRLTEKENEKLVRGFKSGKTIKALSEEFCLTCVTIINKLKKKLGESVYKELKSKNKKPVQKNIIDKEKADGRRNIPVKKENLPKSSIKFNFNRNTLNKNINTVISILTLKLIKSKVKVFFF